MAHARAVGSRRKRRVGGANHGVRPSRRQKTGLRAQRMRLRAGLIQPGER